MRIMNERDLAQEALPICVSINYHHWLHLQSYYEFVNSKRNIINEPRIACVDLRA